MDLLFRNDHESDRALQNIKMYSSGNYTPQTGVSNPINNRPSE